MSTNALPTRICIVLLTVFLGFVTGTSNGLIGYASKQFAATNPNTITIATTIREQVAVTTITQVFRNTTGVATTAMYGIQVPTAAMVTSMRWKINGQWYKASINAPDTSNNAGGCSGTVPQSNTFASVFSQPAFMFAFKDTVQRDSQLTVELSYVELLPYRFGKLAYRYNATPAVKGQTVVLDSWSVDIQSGRNISEVTSAPVVLPVTQQTDNSVLLADTMIPVRAEGLEVSFKPRYDSLTMNVLSTKPADDDGYALMTAIPHATDNSSEIMPKRFTFVFDRSGSMAADKRLDRAKQAAQYCITHLGQEDVFNVLSFASESETCFSEHRPYNSMNEELALKFINNTFYGSGTEITGALIKALASHKADNYVNVIIFITDGEAIIDFERIAKSNTSATRIFVFGVGSSVNEKDLRRIATDNNGAAAFSSSSSSALLVITGLYDQIKDPMIKNPKISFSPAVVYDTYPEIVPDIYKGQQLVLVGRYKTPGDVVVNVTGTNRQGDVSFPFAANLTDDPNINIFVAKIWAKYRIDMMLEWMKKEPTTSAKYKEWKEEIIRLGIKYGIVTSFTTLVDNGDRDNGTTGIAHDGIDILKYHCTIAPNPVRNATTITLDFSNIHARNVRVEIFDLQGAVVATLYDDVTVPDQLQLYWNGANNMGTQVAAGVYQLVVTFDGERSVTTINVVR